MSYYATLDNTKLYYEIVGEGEPIIFIHGWTGSTKTFAPVVNILKKNYKCISYDHRGHGASSFPEIGYTLGQLGRDLSELIEYLGFDKVNLVGHSMGAATIYSYIDQFGCDKLSKITLLDMSPKLMNDSEWQKGLLSGAYQLSDYMNDMEMMSQSMGDFMWRFWRLAIPDFAALPEQMKEFVAPGLLGINHPHALICLWHSMLHADYRDAIKKIEVPAIYGLPDYPLYGEETAKYIKENANSNVDIILFENSTHMIQEEHPEKTASVIDQFLKKA